MRTAYCGCWSSCMDSLGQSKWHAAGPKWLPFDCSLDSCNHNPAVAISALHNSFQWNKLLLSDHLKIMERYKNCLSFAASRKHCLIWKMDAEKGLLPHMRVISSFSFGQWEMWEYHWAMKLHITRKTSWLIEPSETNLRQFEWKYKRCLIRLWGS